MSKCRHCNNHPKQNLSIGLLISGLHDSVQLFQRLTRLHGRFDQALVLQTNSDGVCRPGRGDLLHNVPRHSGLLGRCALLLGYRLGIGQGLTELGRIITRGRFGIDHLDLLQLRHQEGPHGFELGLVLLQPFRQSLETRFVVLASLLVVGGALNVKRALGCDRIIRRVHLLDGLPRQPGLLGRCAELLAGRQGLLDGLAGVDSGILEGGDDGGGRRRQLVGAAAVDERRRAGRASGHGGRGDEEGVGELHCCCCWNE
mmetsp:Transcript_95/g.193  ORF Transcript_95/g.193 Transcript_95/m.193 type:complete len:257 (+) Transcript_95:106-876(+)